MKLHLAKDFALPAEAVTQTFAILGIRGSGKTNTGVVMTEELLKAKQQVIVIDPVDVWWGLKSSKDGRHPGFSLPVIGGDHADIPLDGAAGPALADFVSDTRASVILSLRHLSMNDQRKFAGEFAKRLYDRKGEQRSPLMLMVDEADEFCPQRIPHGHEAMFGAFDRLVRRGRSSGIGVTLISQRAQVINKDVLSQMETLIAMRVLHKLDRKALEAWIEAHDTEGRKDEFLASLASLGKGDAWIWSPSWLGVFSRVHIRQRETFDSSATPETGGKVAAPKELAPVDLEKLRAQMSAQIEKAKADDPRELRKRIAELERAGKSRHVEAVDSPPALKVSNREVLQKAKETGAAQMARQMGKEFQSLITPLRKALLATTLTLRQLADHIEKSTPPEKLEFKAAAGLPVDDPDPVPVLRSEVRRPAAKVQVERKTEGDAGLSGPEQRILDAIAWMESIGVNAPEQTAVAFLAGYTFGGGAFNNPRGALRTKGLVAYAGDGIQLTEEGRAAANYPAEVLDSAELQRRVLERLPGAERRILQVRLDAYPNSIANDACARAAGYTPDGGAYNNPRGRLRTLGLIEYRSGQVRAKDLLFLGGK